MASAIFTATPRASREIAAGILRRLRFSGEDTARILLLVEQHDLPLGDNGQGRCAAVCQQIGEARFRDLLAIKKGDAVGQGTHPEDIAWLHAIENG